MTTKNAEGEQQIPFGNGRNKAKPDHIPKNVAGTERRFPAGMTTRKAVMEAIVYWQASQVGSSMAHIFGFEAVSEGLAARSDTALSLPSVRFIVDFSTWVAERERR